jgi:hypothetical protein
MAIYGIYRIYGKHMAKNPKIWQMPSKEGKIETLAVGAGTLCKNNQYDIS